MCAVAPMSCRPQPGSVARHAACPDLPMPLWVTPRWTALPTVFVSWVACHYILQGAVCGRLRRQRQPRLRQGKGRALCVRFGRGCTQVRQGLHSSSAGAVHSARQDRICISAASPVLRAPQAPHISRMPIHNPERTPCCCAGARPDVPPVPAEDAGQAHLLLRLRVAHGARWLLRLPLLLMLLLQLLLIRITRQAVLSLPWNRRRAKQ